MSSATDLRQSGGHDQRGAGSEHRTTVLSVEQALSMSYATLRMVHLGYRVIRVEPTPEPGRASWGDPNRFIGQPVAGLDRHSYFVAPNVGKEALALNLKTAEGRALLLNLVRELPVDVFCTNTMPGRHARLGLDYATLAAARPALIWCSISAMGLDRPEVPGYDPALQALCGYMDLTGAADGPPMQCGPPVIDLKAGDEAFTQVIMALLHRERTGEGRCIDISMMHAAVSWLQTFLPMLDMGSPPAALRRAGNQHRQFVPVNCYRTADGHVLIAVGSDSQWLRLVAQPMFATLDTPARATNEGRRRDGLRLHAAIDALTAGHRLAAVVAALQAAEVPHAPITPIEAVMALPGIREALLCTTTPAGQIVRLPPPAVPTAHLTRCRGHLPLAPAYGEHTDAVLCEIGLGAAAIADLRAQGVVA